MLTLRANPYISPGFVASFALAAFTGMAVSGLFGGQQPEPSAWPYGTDEVIARYEISSGRASRVGTQVPAWTLYGDGLVVWTDEVPRPPPGFAREVWTGHLDHEEVEELMSHAVESGYFELEASYRPGPPTPAGHAVAQDADPAPLPLDVAIETLSISLAGSRHRVSVRPAGWADAPEPFRRMRDQVLAVEPRGSQRFVPISFRLRVLLLERRDPGDFPALPRSLAHLDLQTASAAPPALERAEGEALAKVMDKLGASYASDGKVFYLELLAVPPRRP